MTIVPVLAPLTRRLRGQPVLVTYRPREVFFAELALAGALAGAVSALLLFW